eukprot:scaffold227_cov165-Amphora_coffeaeformis.AAC.14
MRMCGVQHEDFHVACNAFQESFNYYSLCDINGSATNLLKRANGTCFNKSWEPQWWTSRIGDSSSDTNGAPAYYAEDRASSGVAMMAVLKIYAHTVVVFVERAAVRAHEHNNHRFDTHMRILLWTMRILFATSQGTMKNHRRILGIFFILLASLLGVVNAVGSSSSNGNQVASLVEQAKSWGDRVLQVFQDPLSLLYMFSAVQDLLTRFENIYLELTQQVAQTISTWWGELFQSRHQLAVAAKERLDAVNTDVRELVQLRQKIEVRCLHPIDTQTRSLCVQHNMELDQKLKTARQKQAQSRKKYDAYKDYL